MIINLNSYQRGFMHGCVYKDSFFNTIDNNNRISLELLNYKDDYK